ncbi:hypothetical protein Pcinc_014287 [Petrolisthes cinctipes]|uniref:Uncharacterized protein n=1 Tax=Petrolisthes cinctipes TaxID=88211 RepID=A0AAE1FY40_PETCI|nr:hypothetical protein Pcinc_014287 [Petrolisthes cinctipes]
MEDVSVTRILEYLDLESLDARDPRLVQPEGLTITSHSGNQLVFTKESQDGIVTVNGIPVNGFTSLQDGTEVYTLEHFMALNRNRMNEALQRLTSQNSTEAPSQRSRMNEAFHLLTSQPSTEAPNQRSRMNEAFQRLTIQPSTEALNQRTEAVTRKRMNEAFQQLTSQPSTKDEPRGKSLVPSRSQQRQQTLSRIPSSTRRNQFRSSLSLSSSISPPAFQFQQAHKATQEAAPEFLQAHETTQEAAPEFLQAHETTQDAAPEFLQAHETTQDAAPEFLQAHETTQDAATEFLQAHETIQEAATEFLQAHEITQEVDIEFQQAHSSTQEHPSMQLEPLNDQNTAAIESTTAAFESTTAATESTTTAIEGTTTAFESTTTATEDTTTVFESTTAPSNTESETQPSTLTDYDNTDYYDDYYYYYDDTLTTLPDHSYDHHKVTEEVGLTTLAYSADHVYEGVSDAPPSLTESDVGILSDVIGERVGMNNNGEKVEKEVGEKDATLLSDVGEKGEKNATFFSDIVKTIEGIFFEAMHPESESKQGARVANEAAQRVETQKDSIPVTETEVPTVETIDFRAAHESETFPSFETAEPVFEISRPMKENESLAIIETETLMYDTEAPWYETEAPMYDTEAPMYDTEAPMYDTEAPMYDTEAPMYDTEAPMYDTEAPMYDTEAPMYDTEAPMYDTEAPMYDTEAPMYDTEAPIYDTEAPIYDTEAPMYDTITPIYDTETSVYDTETPMYDTITPIYDTETPIYDTETPIYDTFTPIFDTETPNIEANVPLIEERVPILVEERVPLLEERVPLLEERVPLIEERVPLIEVPLLEDRVLLTEERVPLIEERVPLIEVPLTEERVPLVEESVPLSEERVPLTEVIVPLIEERVTLIEVPRTEERVPLVEERVPLTEVIVPLIEERVPVTEERVPLTEVIVPLIEERVPLIEDIVPLLDEEKLLIQIDTTTTNPETIMTTATETSVGDLRVTTEISDAVRMIERTSHSFNDPYITHSEAEATADESGFLLHQQQDVDEEGENILALPSILQETIISDLMSLTTTTRERGHVIPAIPRSLSTSGLSLLGLWRYAVSEQQVDMSPQDYQHIEVRTILSPQHLVMLNIVPQDAPHPLYHNSPQNTQLRQQFLLDYLIRDHIHPDDPRMMRREGLRVLNMAGHVLTFKKDSLSGSMTVNGIPVLYEESQETGTQIYVLSDLIFDHRSQIERAFLKLVRTNFPQPIVVGMTSSERITPIVRKVTNHRMGFPRPLIGRRTPVPRPIRIRHEPAVTEPKIEAVEPKIEPLEKTEIEPKTEAPQPETEPKIEAAETKTEPKIEAAETKTEPKIETVETEIETKREDILAKAMSVRENIETETETEGITLVTETRYRDNTEMSNLLVPEIPFLVEATESSSLLNLWKRAIEIQRQTGPLVDMEAPAPPAVPKTVLSPHYFAVRNLIPHDLRHPLYSQDSPLFAFLRSEIVKDYLVSEAVFPSDAVMSSKEGLTVTNMAGHNMTFRKDEQGQMSVEWCQHRGFPYTTRRVLWSILFPEAQRSKHQEHTEAPKSTQRKYWVLPTIPEIPRAVLQSEGSTLINIWHQALRDQGFSDTLKPQKDIKTVLSPAHNAMLVLTSTFNPQLPHPLYNQSPATVALRTEVLLDYLVDEAIHPNDPRMKEQNGITVTNLAGHKLTFKMDEQGGITVNNTPVTRVTHLSDGTHTYTLSHFLFTHTHRLMEAAPRLHRT